MGPVTADGDGSKITCILAGLTHTFLAVVCHHEPGDRALLAGRGDHLDHIVAMLSAGTFPLSQTDSLADDLSFFIYTAAELGFRSRDQLKGDLIPLFIQFSGKGQLCYLMQNVILDL